MHEKILAEAIASSVPSRLDELARDVSRMWGVGQLSDEEAGGLFALIDSRRRSGGERTAPASGLRGRVASHFPARRKLQRSPDRDASIRRRRTLSSAGALPPALAAAFTESERAVLAVLVAEVRGKGACDRSIDELAARAGVSRSTAKNALRQAERLRLVAITRRPVRGRKNLTNLVEIVSAEWRLWIDRGASKPVGVKARAPSDISCFKKEPKRSTFAPFALQRGAKKRGAEAPQAYRDGESRQTSAASVPQRW